MRLKSNNLQTPHNKTALRQKRGFFGLALIWALFLIPSQVHAEDPFLRRTATVAVVSRQDRLLSVSRRKKYSRAMTPLAAKQ